MNCYGRKVEVLEHDSCFLPLGTIQEREAEEISYDHANMVKALTNLVHSGEFKKRDIDHFDPSEEQSLQKSKALKKSIHESRKIY